ncbi:DUF4357 domain-containing protein [Streptomyces zagrosensis]|uniref:DUF4357 domain-containing protein n=1 Tax=Streptomyces zagrosensis TaxID=1042984 RepID=A0A7W9QBI3_9ACTN|nr:DUF4357 domain-containing protein [Streptomyces zagrosensis]MBB5937211.1 hypothetical protein [Streptomyces zagrosensis]
MSHPEFLPGTPELRIKLPKGGEARGHLLAEFGGNGTHKFLLREGCLVAAETWPGLGDHARRNRADLRASGGLADVTADPNLPPDQRRFRATRDIECNSPSAAAALVYGYDASGPESWRTAEGHPLADYLSTGWRASRKAWLVRGCPPRASGGVPPRSLCSGFPHKSAPRERRCSGPADTCVARRYVCSARA